MKLVENTPLVDANSEHISVVIPLYNKIDFIGACIESVLSQSIAPGEIIIVNDGSTDGSDRFVEKHFGNKVRLVQQLNQGVSVARNNGIQQAKLNYIALLDADDQWDSNYLNIITQLISKHPSCDIFATGYQLIYPDRIENPTYSGLNKDFNGELTNYFKHSMREWSLLTSSSTVIRKSKLIEIGMYTPNLRLGEDTDLWCRLAIDTRIAFSSQALAKYFCFNDSSVTNTIIPKEELAYSKFLTDALNKNTIPKPLISDVRKFISIGLQYLVREHAKRGNYRFVIKYLFDGRLYHFMNKGTLKMILAIMTPGVIYTIVKKYLIKNNK